MTRIIEVLVSPTGETKVETKGFLASTCREASKSLEAALGKSVNETVTGEFFATVNVELAQSHQS